MSSIAGSILAGAAVLSIAAASPADFPREDAHLYDFAAELVAPRQRVRPSVWAEANVTLLKEQSERPGAFGMDYLPYTEVLHDHEFDHPEKRGQISIKPASVGFSRAEFNKMACRADTDPGLELYVGEKDDKIRKFATEQLKPTLRRVGGGRLAAAIDREVRDNERRDITLSIPLPGGGIDMASAGTESSTTGTSYKTVSIDEYEMSMIALPAGRGDLWTSAKQRTKRYKFTGSERVFGHPRYEHQGLHQLWFDLSDHGAWGFDCPHCVAFVAPRWAMVRYRLVRDADGRPDPSSAWLCCPHCGEEITDAQRAVALWPAHRRVGGSGRVQGDLSPAESATREYLGLWITGLCDPSNSVVKLARGLDAAVKSGRLQAIMDWWNKEEGEPFAPLGNSDITDDSLRAVELTLDGMLLPEDVEFVVAGADVQAPPENPTLYVCLRAFARSGMQYTVAYQRISGVSTFAAYHKLLQGASFRTVDGRSLGVLADCMDAGYATSQVLEQARVPLWGAGGLAIRRMAVRYESKIAADQPMRMRADTKREKPGRPDLGLVDYRDLHRHTWVDRELQGLIQKRMKVCCDKPERWREHMTANVLRPVEQLHGQEPDRMEWTKPEHKDFRDDWMQAGAYTIVAAVAHGELETIHLRGQSGGGYTDFKFGGRVEERGAW